MGTIVLHRGPFGSYEITREGDAPWSPRNQHPRSILIQTDYDYPGVASTFGWSTRNVARTTVDSERFALPLPCSHDGTDGTVTCLGCDTPASAFIESAAAFLDDHDGATADDPGYFGAD